MRDFILFFFLALSELMHALSCFVGVYEAFAHPDYGEFVLVLDGCYRIG